jgi:serine/threonine-protein kinase RsbW
MDDTLDISIPPEPACLAYVRARAERFLRGRVSDVDADDVVLSLSEACKNGIRSSGTRVHVRLAFAPEGLRVQVSDGGDGFDVAAQGHECPDALAIGGRGLYLIHALMDDVTIACEGGTTVTMVKRVAAAAKGTESGRAA